MTTETAPSEVHTPLRLEVRGVPILYAGNQLITAFTGWAGATLDQQTVWAERVLTAVNERPKLLERVRVLEEALKRAREWGIHSKAYSANVSFDIGAWVDAGMVDDLPSPETYPCMRHAAKAE